MSTRDDLVLQTLEPATHDLGGFKVYRTLPHRERTMVGPFLFFDQMGPAHLPPGNGVDVRPHPHIGLSTVTYLFEGAFQHRDSLGSDIRITPGAVNLMTAGAGIVHSERSPDDVRIDSSTSPRGDVLEVHVHPYDRGRVIGRGGRTAKALRTLISALSDGRRVRVDVADD